MPGFEGILNGDSDSKFTLILVESYSAAYVTDHLRQLCKSYSDRSKFRTQLVSVAYDFNLSHEMVRVIHHDFLRNAFPHLGVLLKIITANCNGATKDILIIDDLQVLLVNSDKDYGRLLYFFTVMQKRCQIFAVMDKDTASAADLKFIHSQVDTVVTLTGDASPNPFLCNIIKTKYSGKIVHEQTFYEIINGLVREIPKAVKSGAPQTQCQKENKLNSLTTFKLTLEKEELDSKNRLYLPYFNAQSNNPSDPDFHTFEDEEEEDEEV